MRSKGLLFLAAFTFVFAGCVDHDDTPPNVSAVVPANAATGVSVNYSVVVRFSEEIAPETLSVATFKLVKDSDLTPVEGSVLPADKAAVFIPAQTLEGQAKYRIVLTTDVTDLAGNPLEKEYTSTFTTAQAMDREPPRVVSHDPSAFGTDVNPTAVISIRFNEALDPTSISDASVALKADQGASLAVTRALSEDGKTLSIKPEASLLNGVTYAVSLSSGLRDLAGNALASPYAFSFTVRAPIWERVGLEGHSTSVGAPTAVIDSTGRIVFAYMLSSGINSVLYANTISPDGVLGFPQLLDASASSGVRLVRLASDEVLAIFSSVDSGQARLKASVLPAGSSSWSAPVTLSSAGNTVTTEACGVSSAGAMIAWGERNASNVYSVFARLYRPGAGWSAAQQIPAGSALLGRVAVAAHPTLGYQIYFVQRDNTFSVNRIYKTTHDLSPTSPWSSVNTISPSSVSAVDVAANWLGSGKLVVLWSGSDQTTSLQTLRVTSFSDGGLQSGGGTLIAGSQASITSLQTVALGDLRLVMGWTHDNAVQTASFNLTDEGAFLGLTGVTTRKDPARAFQGGSFRLTADLGGNTALATWIDRDDPNFADLQLATFAASAGWTKPQRIQGNATPRVDVIAGNALSRDGASLQAVFSATADGSDVADLFQSQER